MLTNASTVKRFLEMYLSLGKIQSAEDVCRIDIIIPAMETILNENYLRSCNNDLKELFSQCYTFLQKDLKYLLQAAAIQNNEYASFSSSSTLSYILSYMRSVTLILHFHRTQCTSHSFAPIIFISIPTTYHLSFGFFPSIFPKTLFFITILIAFESSLFKIWPNYLNLFSPQ